MRISKSTNTPRKTRSLIKWLTINEIESLVRVAVSARDKAILRLGFGRGLRASEVGKLHLDDFRRAAGRLMVHRAKGSISAEYPLLKSELKALAAWLKVRGIKAGPLFPSRLGTAISQQMLDVLMKKYGALAGIPPDRRHFHVLRHSCAMWLLEMGRGLEEVQDWLGHANVQNTVIYARISGKRRQRVVDELERAL